MAAGLPVITKELHTATNLPVVSSLHVVHGLGSREAMTQQLLKGLNQMAEDGYVAVHEAGIHSMGMSILEELIRGNTLKKPSKTTIMFAKMFQKMMSNAGCLGENKEIINEKLS